MLPPSSNPFRIGNHELDAMPSDQQAKALWRIYDGDRIILDTRGATFTWKRGGAKPRRYLIESLLDNQWVLPPRPDGPLFGQQGDGRLRRVRPAPLSQPRCLFHKP
jgi:hypothetical protein